MDEEFMPDSEWHSIDIKSNQTTLNLTKVKKLTLFTFFLLALTSGIRAQTDTIIIKTSAVCETCKKTIEHDLSFEKGVKSSVLDVETRQLTVIYNSSKTTPDKIRQRISKIGYDADDVKRNPKGFEKLPGCCKQEEGHH